VPSAKSIPLILVLSAMPLFALGPFQHRGGGAPPPAPAPKQNNPAPQISATPNSQGDSNGYGFHLNGPGPHRGDWLRKYGSLPPSEQEQKLQSDPAFRSLSPDKQSRLMERLKKFNNQPPEKKAQILNRMETYEHMTPQQQEAARSLYSQYRGLPDDQKSKINQAYRRLRGMPPSAREELLNSPEFRNNFTDDERNLLRGMADLNMPSR
jgi:Protein of unknown function (DUF3106)